MQSNAGLVKPESDATPDSTADAPPSSPLAKPIEPPLPAPAGPDTAMSSPLVTSGRAIPGGSPDRAPATPTCSSPAIALASAATPLGHKALGMAACELSPIASSLNRSTAETEGTPRITPTQGVGRSNLGPKRSGLSQAPVTGSGVYQAIAEENRGVAEKSLSPKRQELVNAAASVSVAVADATKAASPRASLELDRFGLKTSLSTLNESANSVSPLRSDSPHGLESMNLPHTSPEHGEKAKVNALANLFREVDVKRSGALDVSEFAAAMMGKAATMGIALDSTVVTRGLDFSEFKSMFVGMVSDDGDATAVVRFFSMLTSSWMVKLEALKETSDASTGRVAELEQSLRDKEHRWKSSHNITITEVENDLESATKEITTTKSELSRLRRKSSLKEKVLSDVQVENHRLLSELDELRRETDRQSTQLQTAGAARSRLEGEAAEQALELLRMEKLSTELSDEVEQLREATAELMHQRSMYERLHPELEEDFMTLNTTVARLKDENSTLHRSHMEMNKDYQDETENLNMTIDLLREQLEKAAFHTEPTMEQDLFAEQLIAPMEQVSLMDTVAELMELQRSNASLKENNAALHKSNAALMENNAALRNSALMESNAALTEDNVALKDSTAALQGSNDALTERNAALQSGTDALTQRNDALQNNNAVLTQRNAVLIRSLAQERDRVRECQKQLAQEISRGEQLGNLLQQADGRGRMSEQEMVQLREELCEEQSKVEQLKLREQQLGAQIMVTELKLQEARNQDQIQDELSQAQSKIEQLKLRERQLGAQIMTTELKLQDARNQAAEKAKSNHTKPVDATAQTMVVAAMSPAPALVSPSGSRQERDVPNVLTPGSENKRLKAQNEALNSRNGDFAEVNEALRKDVSWLIQAVHKLKKKNKKLTAAGSTARSSLSSLTSQNNEGLTELKRVGMSPISKDRKLRGERPLQSLTNVSTAYSR